MFTEEQYRQDFSKRLSDTLREKGLLEERGIISKLAKVTDISPTAVRKWFSAEAMPSMVNTHLLANFLDVSPEWLTFGVDSQQPTTHIQPEIKEIDYRKNWQELQAAFADYAPFKITVCDETMLPEFQVGDSITFDPKTKLVSGRYVLAKTAENTLLFAQYRQVSNGTFALVPLNHAFEAMLVSKEDVLGVAVEVRRSL